MDDDVRKRMEEIKPTPRTNPADGLDIGRVGISVLSFNMNLYEDRLRWAKYLFDRLDESNPVNVPTRPWELRGIRYPEIAKMLKRERSAGDQDTVRIWVNWRRRVEYANGRNRQTLRSLRRVVEIFNEKPETAGQAEMVRKFIAARWSEDRMAA